MQYFVLLAAVIGVAASAELWRGKPERDEDWKQFKASFGKNYKDSTDETKRRAIWEKNRDTIDAHNAEAAKGVYSYWLGDNHLADRDNDERKSLLGAKRPTNVRDLDPINDMMTVPETRQVIPSTFDLRTSKCLPAVKNQGNCGSCWAFAATTPVEFLSCNKTATKTPFVLSESQLVNCSAKYGNYGCNGGWMSSAWNYVRAAPGQAKSSVLPYYPSNGNCKYNNATMKAANVVSYTQLPNNATHIMRTLATRGPLPAAMQVSGTFDLYKSGVFSNSTCPKNCSEVNHGVVLVGYGTANATNPYWIVRNSWGSTWGAAGYFLISRGRNMCNIECYTYAVSV